jgi:hypothetical protein
MGDGYAGPVTVVAGEVTVRADARLTGQVEPVDGRFHWGGRLAPGPELAGLVRAGSPAALLRVDDGPWCEARLAEVDPWGGIRVSALGSPPWTVEEPAVPDEAVEDLRRTDLAAHPPPRHR